MRSISDFAVGCWHDPEKQPHQNLPKSALQNLSKIADGAILRVKVQSRTQVRAILRVKDGLFPWACLFLCQLILHAIQTSKAHQKSQSRWLPTRQMRSMNSSAKVPMHISASFPRDFGMGKTFGMCRGMCPDKEMCPDRGMCSQERDAP